MKNKNLISVQDWLPFKKILNDGIIFLKNNNYLKILKISPINFNLKSELEKQAILNSYKIFLKTCNFDLQILIQSNKRNLSTQISILKKINQNSQFLQNLSNEYISYITKMNEQNETSEKCFYLILKETDQIDEKIIRSNLNEKYFKIKDLLSRCGNYVEEINQQEEIKKILNSFLNYRKNK